MLVKPTTGALRANFLVFSLMVASQLSAQSATTRDPATPEPKAAVALDEQAAAAGGVSEEVLDLLNSVSDRVDTTINRATEARNSAGEMVDNLHDGLQNLTGEMRERIQDAVNTLQQALQDELGGAADFIDGPNSCSPICEAFRDKLVTLLTSMQDISNAVLDISDIQGQVDLSREISFIEALSGKALFPLYRVLQTLPVLDQDFLDTMSQVAANLNDIKDFVVDTADRAAEFDKCQLLAKNEELLGHVIFAAQNIDKVGKGAKMAGSILSAIGKTKIAARVGIWGWAGISYSSGILERFGNLLESLGNRLTPIAEKLKLQIQYCVLTVNQGDIMEMVDTNHSQVAQSQQAILDAVKAIQVGQGNGADLNSDQIVDLKDFSLFQNAFGSTGG